MDRDKHLGKICDGINTSNVLLAQILQSLQQQSELMHSLLAGICPEASSVPFSLVEPPSESSRVNATQPRPKLSQDVVPDHAKAIISAARSFCKPFQRRLSILKTLNLESETALTLTARLLSCRNRDVATAFVSRVQLQLNGSLLDSKKGFSEVVRKITRFIERLRKEVKDHCVQLNADERRAKRFDSLLKSHNDESVSFESANVNAVVDAMMCDVFSTKVSPNEPIEHSAAGGLPVSLLAIRQKRPREQTPSTVRKLSKFQTDSEEFPSSA